MNTHDHNILNIPSLDSLVLDLLTTTSHQRWIALLRPILGVVAYVAAAALELWWLTPIIVFLLFVSVVTVTHDVVHGTIGLNKHQTTGRCFSWVRCCWKAVMPIARLIASITHFFPKTTIPKAIRRKLA